MDRKGRRINAQLKGSLHPSAKLTELQVVAARALFDYNVLNLTKIAALYDLSMATMSKILRRELWRHVA
jgi:hypothetical protein